VDVIDLEMTLLDPAFPLFSKFAEDFAQMGAEASVQHLPPTFGDENNVVLALPFRVA
jgi:hypothetical protein